MYHEHFSKSLILHLIDCLYPVMWLSIIYFANPLFCYIMDFFQSLTVTVFLPFCIKVIDEAYGPVFQVQEAMLPPSFKKRERAVVGSTLCRSSMYLKNTLSRLFKQYDSWTDPSWGYGRLYPKCSSCLCTNAWCLEKFYFSLSLSWQWDNKAAVSAVIQSRALESLTWDLFFFP